ncbi:unnamed protein product [Dibothriocephalus latus]|uniref:Enkurin domain-containing protein n=1 Tax=Dibothriocephalus latus TaxID=60516 RepID=A0A3P7P7W9_DIBLA|nr:unnamed protein product [Dibothriocephalus latus]
MLFHPYKGAKNTLRCHFSPTSPAVERVKAIDMASLVAHCGETDPTSATLEKRYSELQLQKRYLETCLSKVPLTKFDKNRISTLKWKEDLEAQLDRTDAELGSIRLSLRKLNAFK